MSNGKTIPVNLRIFDKDYVMACPEEERETLMACAQYLQQKIAEVRVGGKVVSNERLVVVSALSIIHEYFQYKQQKEEYLKTMETELKKLRDKIEVALLEVKP